ncbi:MAG: radical SAM protein [Candidatus Rokuibacteriota bacterium]
MEYRQFDFYGKALFHHEQVTRYLAGMRPVPVNVEIDLTNACNHRCTFCQWGSYIQSNRATLPETLVRRTLGELRALGTRAITWTGGGEPTLHKGFFALLDHGHGLGLDNGLITNGSRVDGARDDQLLTQLVWLRVSMAGGDAASYRAVQGRDDFDLVIGNLRRLAEAKRRRAATLDIGVAFLVNRVNVRSLRPFARLLADASVDYLQLRQDMYGDAAERRWWNDEVLPRVAEVGRDVAGSGLRLLGASYVEAQAALGYPAKCHAHHFVCAINAEGYVCFCKNTRDNPAFYLGNLHAETFTAIWQRSPRAVELEATINPANCATFCKNMEINRALEDVVRGAVACAPPTGRPPIHENFL